MDIHEADKNHLIQAHASAITVVQNHDDWVQIDCERGGEMRSIERYSRRYFERSEVTHPPRSSGTSLKKGRKIRNF